MVDKINRMKFFRITLIFIVLLGGACSLENHSKKDDPQEDISFSDSLNSLEGSPATASVEKDTTTTEIVSHFEKPPQGKEEKDIWIKQVKTSPFFDLGCCNEEKNLGQACCCEKVVEKYKAIRQEEDVDIIGKVKTRDPLFAACKEKKQYRAVIESIENEGQDDEEFDF